LGKKQVAYRSGRRRPGSSDLAGTEAVRSFEQSVGWKLEVDRHCG
jgi:hypothetical protein